MTWGVSDPALLDYCGEGDIDTTEPREALKLRVVVTGPVRVRKNVDCGGG